MNRLIKLFSLACLSSLCLFAVSCDDDDAGCATYFLTEASSSVIVEKLYYNDDGLLAVALQAVDGNAPRRDEYSYNANRQLIRVDIHNFFYNTFSYNDDGDIESIKMYSTASDELNRELKYFYDVDGKLTRREFHQPELIYFELYEYPAANVIEVLSYEVDEEGNEEEFEVIMKFEVDGSDQKYMMVVPLTGENDEEDEVYAFRYEEEGDDLKLYTIEDEEEWNMVEETFNTLLGEMEEEN